MSRVSEYPWRFLPGETHTRRGLAMGRMGITNTVMLLQAIFLYTFSSDDSLHAVNKISFYVDIAYRIALCLWLLLTGYRCVISILCNLTQRRSHDLNSVNHAAATMDLNVADSNVHMAGLNPQTTVNNENNSVNIRGCHLLQNIGPLDRSVEEESPNLNIPAGNVLTHNNIFIRFPNDVNPHWQCQELNDKFKFYNVHQNIPCEPRLFYQQSP